MALDFKRVWGAGARHRRVAQLYREAFPTDEQLPLGVLTLMSWRPGIEFFAIYDGPDFCGLLYQISDREHTLIFYFAVGGELRGKGYGSEILDWIKRRKRSVSVIMESLHEPCDNPGQRRRRADFYLRNGFFDTGYYMKGRSGIYDILCTDPGLDPEVYARSIHRLLFWVPRDIIGKF